MTETEELRGIVARSSRTVFFGGAGVSTDSGIPDFRGAGGLYRTADPSEDPPEYLLSRDCLEREPEKFFDYYRNHMIYEDARPNAAHVALALMERRGLLHAVVTQNIDGLHQEAGSRNVYELHGTVKRNYCASCGKPYGPDAISAESKGIPRCPCGGVIRPDVVLYGESLDMETLIGAEREIEAAEVLIVGGTSLTVNPAASLVSCFGGDHLIIINRSRTPYDRSAEYVIRDSLSDVLPQLF